MWNWWFLLCSWLTGTGASDSAPFIITDHPARRKAEERSQLGPLGQPKGPSATLSPGQSRSATWAFRSDEDKAPTWTLSEKGIPCHPLQQEGKTYHGCHPDGWCCLDITCSKTDHCDMATKDQATPGPPLRLPRDPVTTPCELDAGGETFHWDPEEDLNLMFLLLQEDVEGLQEEDLESLVKLSSSQPLRIFEALKPPIPRATSTWDALGYALRMVESAAFSLHSLFVLSEPCHGILHQLTDGPRGHLVHPSLFFPIAGAMLALVAVTNFSAKKHLVLVAQCYVVAFHTGGAAVHLKVGHHPVAALGPGGFVLLGFLVLWLQQDLITALLGTGSCVVLGLSLSAMLVKRKEGTDALLEDQ